MTEEEEEKKLKIRKKENWFISLPCMQRSRYLPLSLSVRTCVRTYEYTRANVHEYHGCVVKAVGEGVGQRHVELATSMTCAHIRTSIYSSLEHEARKRSEVKLVVKKTPFNKKLVLGIRDPRKHE